MQQQLGRVRNGEQSPEARERTSVSTFHTSNRNSPKSLSAHKDNEFQTNSWCNGFLDIYGGSACLEARLIGKAVCLRNRTVNSARNELCGELYANYRIPCKDAEHELLRLTRTGTEQVAHYEVYCFTGFPRKQRPNRGTISIN